MHYLLKLEKWRGSFKVHLTILKIYIFKRNKWALAEGHRQQECQRVLKQTLLVLVCSQY